MFVTTDAAISAPTIRRLADEVFESCDQANGWFETPINALNGNTPGSLMHDQNGRENVYTILVRIRDGVFS